MQICAGEVNKATNYN